MLVCRRCSASIDGSTRRRRVARPASSATRSSIRSTTVVVLRSVAPQDGLDRPQRQAPPGKAGYAAFSKYLDEAENQTFGQRQETQKAPTADDGWRPESPWRVAGAGLPAQARRRPSTAACGGPPRLSASISCSAKASAYCASPRSFNQASTSIISLNAITSKSITNSRAMSGADLLARPADRRSRRSPSRTRRYASTRWGRGLSFPDPGHR